MKILAPRNSDLRLRLKFQDVCIWNCQYKITFLIISSTRTYGFYFIENEWPCWHIEFTIFQFRVTFIFSFTCNWKTNYSRSFWCNLYFNISERLKIKTLICYELVFEKNVKNYFNMVAHHYSEHQWVIAIGVKPSDKILAKNLIL